MYHTILYLHSLFNFHLYILCFVSVGFDGSITCFSRVPYRCGLSVGRDISFCGLPYTTRKRFGTTDHGQIHHTQITLWLYYIIPVKSRRKVKIHSTHLCIGGYATYTYYTFHPHHMLKYGINDTKIYSSKVWVLYYYTAV